jgi:hypothetical protein
LVEYSKNNKIKALVTSNNKSNSLIGEIDNTNKNYLINLTEPDTKKAKKVNKNKASIFKKYKTLDYNKDSNNKKTKSIEDSNNKENSNSNKGSQTSIKTPIIIKKYIVSSSSYYIKY